MIATKQLSISVFPVVLYKVILTFDTIDELNSTYDRSKERCTFRFEVLNVFENGDEISVNFHLQGYIF